MWSQGFGGVQLCFLFCSPFLLSFFSASCFCCFSLAFSSRSFSNASDFGWLLFFSALAGVVKWVLILFTCCDCTSSNSDVTPMAAHRQNFKQNVPQYLITIISNVCLSGILLKWVQGTYRLQKLHSHNLQYMSMCQKVLLRRWTLIRVKNKSRKSHLASNTI